MHKFTDYPYSYRQSLKKGKALDPLLYGKITGQLQHFLGCLNFLHFYGNRCMMIISAQNASIQYIKIES